MAYDISAVLFFILSFVNSKFLCIYFILMVFTMVLVLFDFIFALGIAGFMEFINCPEQYSL